MVTLRDDLIEIGARALCKGTSKADPDYVPPSKYCWIDGKPVPNWKHHARLSAMVVDAIFDYQRRRAAQPE